MDSTRIKASFACSCPKREPRGRVNNKCTFVRVPLGRHLAATWPPNFNGSGNALEGFLGLKLCVSVYHAYLAGGWLRRKSVRSAAQQQREGFRAYGRKFVFHMFSANPIARITTTHHTAITSICTIYPLRNSHVTYPTMWIATLSISQRTQHESTSAHCLCLLLTLQCPATESDTINTISGASPPELGLPSPLVSFVGRQAAPCDAQQTHPHL